MAKKKKETHVETTDVQTNGTHETATAPAEPRPPLPVETPNAALTPRPEPELAHPPANGNGARRPTANEPVQVFSYPVSLDA